MEVVMGFDLQAFLGWTLVLNFGLLMFTAFWLIALKEFTLNLHHKIYKIPKEKLEELYLKFMTYYKLVIIVFNFTPYIALRLM